ncbi:Hypothetical protein CulFRC11_1817 [Corynebacterium ramonii]|uniref:Uncharacterized protein n=1 Tax=Corynebacterium ramonii TaxID=3026968 RepID=A0ABN4EI55_9CORY|nr:Hypothetical protein CulFRC11_1817 [Corynebacterium ramonii FRC0011]ESU57539.1 hypothetical protein D881_10450 [Corynebacterium ulcerans NCTC 12077]
MPILTPQPKPPTKVQVIAAIGNMEQFASKLQHSTPAATTQ